ncbi:MAG TPA: M23 family metallopeptidase [Candidatus Dormibacteraeota bacterium]|nr:M23 family metallopeptidase [Candidatus Dormibacteraeota bacterium]
MIRLLAAGAVAVGVWLVAAAQVPAHPRMTLAEIVVGSVVTQPFGCTTLVLEPVDELCPSHHTHTGIDLAAPTGSEVHSATYGTAWTGYDAAGAGNFVVVVEDPHVRLVYCHLSTFRVHSGDAVTPGQVIGLVGDTGLATGPHLHFQVDVDGVPVDPAAWLGP